MEKTNEKEPVVEVKEEEKKVVAEQPKVEVKKQETQKTQETSKEVPKKEPVAEAPKVEPKVEKKQDAPKVEGLISKEEKPVVEEPQKKPSFTLSNVTDFKESLDTINNLVTEVKIKLDDQGLKIITMDPANVAMVNFSMDKSLFTEWYVDGEHNFAVNIANLKQILKRVFKKALVKFTVGDFVGITIMGNIMKKYNLPIIDEDITDEKVPPLEFKAMAKMDTTQFKEAIEDVKVTSDVLHLSAKNNKLHFRGSGEGMSSEVNLLEEVRVDHKEEQSSKYSLEYVSKMIGKFDKVKVSFGSDYPLALNYENEEGTLKMGFILAPRVDSV